MKKIIFSALAIAAVAAGTAFAGQEVPADGTSIGTQAFKPSNNVHLFVGSVSGTSTNPGGFSTASFHSSGNRDFATNSVQPKIFWREKTTTALDASAVGVSGTTYTPDVTSWNSL